MCTSGTTARTKTPWAIAAHDMHPVEFIATACLMLVGPLVVGCHVLVLWIWIAFRQLGRRRALRLRLPLSLTRLLPGSDGALHHDFHHAQLGGNFAGFLAMWIGGSGRGARATPIGGGRAEGWGVSWGAWWRSRALAGLGAVAFGLTQGGWPRRRRPHMGAGRRARPGRGRRDGGLGGAGR
ncbi:MAG: sterol desaturase family protein [Myxococcales bacterium]|nr:sterol desaturase family protein [Myxococcales bacterium]